MDTGGTTAKFVFMTTYDAISDHDVDIITTLCLEWLHKTPRLNMSVN